MHSHTGYPLKKNIINSKANRRNAFVKYLCGSKPSAEREIPQKLSRGCCISNTEYDWAILGDHENRVDHYDCEPLSKVIRADSSFDPCILAAIAEDLSTRCILHEAIILGAPDSVLMSLVNCFPSFLTQVDKNGRFPLHVACAYGASSEFIIYCIDMNPSSAASKDIEGKTPAHLLCQSNWNSAQDAKSDSTGEKKMREILRMLYQKDPSSVVSEDNRGLGSVEYAIESNLDIETILLLHEMIGHYREIMTREVAQPKHRITEL